MGVTVTRTDLVVPVMKLLGAGLAAEVPRHAAQLPGHTPLTQLAAVVTGDTLQTKPLDKVLLKQQLTAWEGERDDSSTGKSRSDQSQKSLRL